MSKHFTSDTRHWISLFLAASGAIVLGYVGFQYGSMYGAQYRLERQWQQQQNQLAVYRPANPALTRISSPKIGLDAIVVEGTDVQALAHGPGHMERTAFPGQTGNTVITGHRDTFFRHVDELVTGDTLQLQREGRTYTYEITGKKVVEPTDVSVIRPTPDAELTLITCYPTYYIGPSPKRLVIFSRLIAQPGTEKLRAGDEERSSRKVGGLKKAAGVR